MKVVALISGGKDSCFNMMQCVSAGHQIVALANLTPKTLTEIDSYMYQSVGHEAIDLIATTMDLPLYRKYTEGQSRQQGTTLSYEPTEGDEVEDLYELLEEVKSKENVEGVSVGAILSDYQRLRVENVCNRLNLVPLAYLWRRDQKELLDEMIENKIEAIVIKVAALGLDPHKHLGKTLDSLRPHLHSLHEKYGINVCGEGGEYETLTLDCPLFKSKILIQDSEIVIHSNDPIAPVGYLKLNKLSLQDKHSQLDSDSSEQLKHLALQHTEPFLSKLEINVEDDTTTNESVQHDLYDLMTMNDETLVHHATSFRTPEGFLFIGGIQGYSLDEAIATHQSFEILKSILHKNGHSIEDVCSISMFISGMRHYAAFNEMYSKVFTFANPPTRVCVEIPVVNPVIMSAISWAPPLSCEEDKRVERQTMHVQSRSHWAPANIGPYSQAKKIGDTVHLAGQIGLNPGNLELVKGGITAECHMTLRHAERLIQAMDSGQDLRNVVQGICYVTNSRSIERAENIWKQKNQDSIVSYVVVKGLPKNAVVEWHLWTHKHNDQFEYDETEEEFDRFEVKLRRRWSIDSGILCAIACEVENPSAQHLNQHIFFRIANYVVGKLQHDDTDHKSAVCNLTIFTNSCATAAGILQLPEINSHVVYTVVPVSGLRHEHTCFAISGLRHG